MPKKDFLDRLQSVIHVLKIEHQEFARRGGITKATFSGYITGKSQPKLGALTAWLEEFNIDANWLFLGDGPMFRDKADGVAISKTEEDAIAYRMRTYEELMRKAGAPDKAIWEGLKAIAEGRADDHSTDQSGVEDGAA